MNQQRRSIYRLRRMVLGFGAGVPVVEYDEDPKTKVKTRREQVCTLEDQREHVLDLVEDLVVDMVGPPARTASPTGTSSRLSAHGEGPVRRRHEVRAAGRQARPRRARGDQGAGLQRRREGLPRARRRSSGTTPTASRSSAATSSTSTSRRSTSSGRTTCSRWTTCARGSGSAATARRIRSRSTRRKATRCSCR